MNIQKTRRRRRKKKLLEIKKYNGRNIFKLKEYLKNKVEEISITNRKLENNKIRKFKD